MRCMGLHFDLLFSMINLWNRGQKKKKKKNYPPSKFDVFFTSAGEVLAKAQRKSLATSSLFQFFVFIDTSVENAFSHK